MMIMTPRRRISKRWLVGSVLCEWLSSLLLSGSLEWTAVLVFGIVQVLISTIRVSGWPSVKTLHPQIDQLDLVLLRSSISLPFLWAMEKKRWTLWDWNFMEYVKTFFSLIFLLLMAGCVSGEVLAENGRELQCQKKKVYRVVHYSTRVKALDC